eukprot:g31068.t1
MADGKIEPTKSAQEPNTKMMEEILEEFQHMRAEFKEVISENRALKEQVHKLSTELNRVKKTQLRTEFEPFDKETSSVNSGRPSTVHTSKSTSGMQGKRQPTPLQGQWQNKPHLSEDSMEEDFPMNKYQRPQETPAQTKSIVKASMKAKWIDCKDADILNYRRLINPRKQNLKQNQNPVIRVQLSSNKLKNESCNTIRMQFRVRKISQAARNTSQAMPVVTKSTIYINESIPFATRKTYAITRALVREYILYIRKFLVLVSVPRADSGNFPDTCFGTSADKRQLHHIWALRRKVEQNFCGVDVGKNRPSVGYTAPVLEVAVGIESSTQ